MNYLSLDLGTTKMKASLFNEDADLLYSFLDEAVLYHDEGIYQQPDDYLDFAIKTIQNIKGKDPNRFKDIGCIIISGQMGGILGVDKDWNPLLPWTYSVDTRYLGFVYDLESRFSKEMRERSGGPPTMAAKIAWVRKENPDRYHKVEKFLNLMGYVSARLCGLPLKDAFMDCTCLSMSGIADIPNLKWDAGLCKKADIEIMKMPKILRPFEAAGAIPKNRFGTKKDIQVLAGCGDQVAGFIGCGLIRENEVIDVSGTYSLLGYCGKRFLGDSRFKVFHSIYSGIQDIYYQLAVISAGGHTFDWFLKNFQYKPKKKKDQYNIPSDVFIVPYFGGRYSPTQPYFKGSFLNLDWKHGTDDLYVSLLESGGYEMNFFMEYLCELNNLKRKDFGEIKIIGAGSENDVESYVKANILRLTYQTLKKVPYENIGTFILAKYKEKIKEGVQDLTLKGLIKIDKSIQPDPAMSIRYDENYLKYKEIVSALEKTYKTL